MLDPSHPTREARLLRKAGLLFSKHLTAKTRSGKTVESRNEISYAAQTEFTLKLGELARS